MGRFIFLVVFRDQESLWKVLVLGGHKKAFVLVDDEEMLTFLSYKPNPRNPINQGVEGNLIVQSSLTYVHAIVCLQRLVHTLPL